MKKIRWLGILFVLTANILLCFPGTSFGLPENDMTAKDINANGMTAKDINANDMTVRNIEYERLGTVLMDALENGEQADGGIMTEVVFNSEQEGHAFGKYFYRYIYLGKEPIVLQLTREAEGYRISITCAEAERAVSQHKQVLDRLSGIVKSCEGMKDWEKAEYFYDWIYRHVSYDKTLSSKTVYDAVINGNAVCWGYVSAYLLLCRSAGLVCEPVYRGNHAWNRVWLDGEWRYCDITWDKSLGESKWKFLTQEEMDSDPLHGDL